MGLRRGVIGLARRVSARRAAAHVGVAVALGLLAAAGPVAAQVTDSAHAAWARGDLETAVPLYEQRLARDSSDLVALHRLALARAWGGRSDESLALYDRLIRLDPGNVEARLDRANALAWDERHDEAIAGAERVLEVDPENAAALAALARFAAWAGRYEASLRYYDRLIARSEAAEGVDAVDARVGRARVLAWSGRYEQSEGELREILTRDPDNIQARKELARVAGWWGHLREGERHWRQVLIAEPQDVDALVGLATNLRWQGRTGAAMDVLDRAERVAPSHADVQEQRQWARATAGPTIAPSYLYESDSDGIRVEAVGLTGTWLVARRVGLQLTAENRSVGGGGTTDAAARSVELIASTGMGRGWTLTAGGGVRFGSVDEMETVALWRVGAATPAYLPLSAAIAAGRRAFDYTPRLARSDVTVDEVTTTIRWSGIDGRLRTSVVGGMARFNATRDNTRWLASASTSYRPTRVLAVGVSMRTFGFSERVDEGYWNPERYGIVEAPVGLSLDQADGLFGRLQVAPGYQAIRQHGNEVNNATLRTAATAGYRFAPGREIGISASVANSGVERVSPVPEAEYNYRSVRIFFDWTLR